MKKSIFVGLACVLFGFASVSAPALAGTGGTISRVGEINEGDVSTSSMATVLCNVLKFVTGTIGKTLASFVIIGVGLGFFTGKVSWGALIGVTLGISALFGAPAIIRAVTGGDTVCSFT